MAIRINANFVNVKPPSWSGSATCKFCPENDNKNAYSIGGMNSNGRFGYKTWCMTCGYVSQKNFRDEPDLEIKSKHEEE